MKIIKAWKHTADLSRKQKETLVLSIAIGNINALTSAMFAGTYSAWLLAGGKHLVNLEHMAAGIAVFLVCHFIGSKDVFSKDFIKKATLLRLGVMLLDLLPLLLEANVGTAIAVVIPAAAFQSMAGYRAKKSNVTWGYRKKALADRNDFAVDFRTFEMAVLSIGAILGMALLPSVTMMVVVNEIVNLITLFLDIRQNKLVVELEKEIKKED